MVKVTGALFHTQGRPTLTPGAALGHAGPAVSNLVIAGGAARGVSGDAVWG
jgi:fumarate reductase flavoprotein subunit